MHIANSKQIRDKTVFFLPGTASHPAAVARRRHRQERLLVRGRGGHQVDGGGALAPPVGVPSLLVRVTT